MTTSDRIVKSIVLRAPQSRVWRAISDAEAFGTWFGVAFDGKFAAGKTMTGKIVPTKVDADIAKSQEPYSGTAFEVVIDRIEPERLFSFRWHPFAIDPKVDYSQEEKTLVVFEIEALDDKSTKVTITESGFDKVPLARRAQAFSMNEGGWEVQTKLLEKYVHAS